MEKIERGLARMARQALGVRSETLSKVEPSKVLTELLKEVLSLNREILEQNATIVRMCAAPLWEVVVADDEAD